LSIAGLPLLLFGAKLFGLYDREEALPRRLVPEARCTARSDDQHHQ
jgi:hypothetical protein